MIAAFLVEAIFDGLFNYNLVIWIERYRYCAWWPACLNRA